MAARRRLSVADSKKAPTQRVNLQVGVDAYERLLIHSIKNKKSPGELVTELIEDHLRQWKVQSNAASRSASAMSEGSVSGEDQGEESLQEAA
jgi:hypothetical protein